jgi:phosphate-selective porin OprO and OprP
MNNYKRLILPMSIAAMVLAVIIRAGLASAQTKPADPKDQEIQLLRSEIKQLEQRVDKLEGLDQKVKVIDQKVEVQSQKLDVQNQKLQVQETSEQQKALNAPIIKIGPDGFSLSSANRDNVINFNGVIQGDGRAFTSGDDKNISSTFYLNRARLIFTGSLARYYNFNITPDFGQGNVVLQDAYLNMTYFHFAELRTGKYKSPLDLERLQIDRDIEFSQRSLIQNMVPNRDYGADLHGGLWEDRLFYDVAVMNGVPNNTASVNSDLNDAKDFVGRVFTTPFELGENQWIKQIGFGIGGSIGDERGTTLSSYRTYGQSTYFTYNTGVTASGQRERLDPQAYYYFRHFGLMAEYAYDEHSLNLNTTIKNGATKEYINRTDTFKDTGYMLQGSYMLTDDAASYGWVKPHSPFDPRNGTWGAWELAARLSNNSADPRQFALGFVAPSVSAKTATEWALGINWYLTSTVKWQFDYANTFFNGGAGTASDVKDRPNESVFESQLQLFF